MTTWRRSYRLRLLIFGLVTAGCVASVLLAVSAGGAPAKMIPVSFVPSGPAATFDLTSVDGPGRVNLHDAQGSAVVLSFFASWCDGCREEMATMATLARSEGAGVDIIGVDVNDDSASARSLLEQSHISYPVGNDAKGAVAEQYALEGLPTTVYLNRDHVVVGRTLGPLTPQVGRSWLTALQKAAA